MPPPATCPEGRLSLLGVVRVGIVFLIFVHGFSVSRGRSVGIIRNNNLGSRWLLVCSDEWLGENSKDLFLRHGERHLKGKISRDGWVGSPHTHWSFYITVRLLGPSLDSCV